MTCDVCSAKKTIYAYDGLYLCQRCFVQMFDREFPGLRGNTLAEKIKIARAVPVRGGRGYDKYF